MNTLASLRDDTLTSHGGMKLQREKVGDDVDALTDRMTLQREKVDDDIDAVTGRMKLKREHRRRRRAFRAFN